MSLPEPLGGLLLSDDVVSALRLASTRRSGPVTTCDLLLATVDTDSYGDWPSVQLASTYISGDDAGAFADPLSDTGGNWEHVPLTTTATTALATARRIAEAYKLFPLPPAVLALGLVADPHSGASRALLAETDLSHVRLIEVIQDGLLGSTLEGLADVMIESSGDHRSKSVRADRGTTAAATVPVSTPMADYWGAGWQLFETPETRRLDAHSKVAAVAEAVLLCAFCLQLVTETVIRSGAWSILLIPAGLAVTFAVGPPRRSPLLSILRVLLAGALRSDVMVATALLLMGAEAINYYYVTPRLLAAGHGGALPDARLASKIRASGLGRARTARLQRLLGVSPSESTTPPFTDASH